MTGEGFWQVEVSGIGQDSDCHLDALHTRKGYTFTACEEHWQHKQGEKRSDHLKFNKETLTNTKACEVKRDDNH